MGWSFPDNYKRFEDPMPVCYAPEAEAIALESARLFIKGTERLGASLPLSELPTLLLHAHLSIESLPPPHCAPASAVYPYLAQNEQEQNIVVFPAAFKPPLKPTTYDMRRLLLWREAARVALDERLDLCALPLWQSELMAWAGAVWVARERQVSLTDILIGMSDGRQPQTIGWYSSPNDLNDENWNDLHKQLLRLCVELYPHYGSELLTRLLITSINFPNLRFGREFFSAALGASGAQWLEQNAHL